ncbi:MAG: 16S rRNA processing protein RimM [Clostridia bacterium]|nr:16S rRNA processing protein RimM [Clostridia bacterium]
MKLDVWCDSFDSLKNVKTVYTDENGSASLNIKTKRVHGNFMLITIEGVDSIESAMRYKTKQLYARREDIPKAETAHFIADLIGLTVYDRESGEAIGTVSDVLNYGASDILEIKRENKKNALVPMIKDFICRIDLQNGIYINTVEGLLD